MGPPTSFFWRPVTRTSGNPTPRETETTCCQADDLANEASELNKRIDQIFVKGVALHPGGTIRTLTVGDKPDDRLSSGLWPSNHAGVVAHLPVE